MNDRYCKSCGKVLKFYQKNFCTPKCYGNWRYGKKIYTNKLIRLKKCLYCKKIISYRRQYKKLVFCSRLCKNLWSSGKNHPLYNKKYEDVYGNKKSLLIKKRQSECSKGKYKNISWDKRFGKKKSLLIKKKVSESHKGKKLSKKTLEKLRKNRLNKSIEEICGYENGCLFRKNMSVMFKGKNSHFYIDGRTEILASNHIKGVVRRRDNNICKFPNCGKKTYNGFCHHIHYYRFDNNEKVMIYLCEKHHKLVHKRTEDKSYWFSYFCHLLDMTPDEVIV